MTALDRDRAETASDDVRRLSFIRRCRDFDFPIEDIRALLSLLRDGKSCIEARKLQNIL